MKVVYTHDSVFWDHCLCFQNKQQETNSVTCYLCSLVAEHTALEATTTRAQGKQARVCRRAEDHALRGQTGRRRRDRGDPSGCHVTQMTPAVSKPNDVTRAR